MKNNIKKIKKYIIGQVGLDAVVVMLISYLPVLQKKMFDIIEQNRKLNIGDFILIYLLCLSAIIGLSYINMLITSRGNIRFRSLLKKDLFKAITNYRNYRFTLKSVPEYISIFNNDIAAIQEDYLKGLISIVKSINMIIIYGATIFIFIDWRIAILISVISIFNIVIFPKFTSKKLAKSRSKYLNKTENYVAKFSDLLQGIRLFNTKTRKQFEYEHSKKMEELSNKQFRYGLTKSKSLVLNGASIYLLYVVSIAMVAYLYITKQISIGAALVSVGYVEVFIHPIQTLMGAINGLNSSKDVREKYKSLIKNEEHTGYDSEFECLKKDIEIKGMNIKFDTFEINNFSYRFEKGKKYALIGRSGSGKSTILKSLVGVNKIDSGDILINGIDSEQFDKSRIFSYMDQDEYIFEEDFKNNVTVFNTYPIRGINRIKDKIENNMYEIITKSENCKLLSGGEKKVVSIMRKLAQDAPILVLDEPFAGVDKKLYRTLLGELLNLKDKTVIMTTHNIKEGLEKFDEVIFMNNGKVIKKGDFNTICDTDDFITLAKLEASVVCKSS
ncbi:ABC transporter ATP-binding protein [Clostridiaceae bacterium M8S5]|nr:ABC transporter ATP-binding protein [Clostridiaceae bacterium M8S5]